MSIAVDTFTLKSRTFDGLFNEAIRCLIYRSHELQGKYPDAMYVNRSTWRSLRRAVWRRVYFQNKDFIGSFNEFFLLGVPVRMFDDLA